MDINTDYSAGETLTTRAYIHLFKEYGELLQFPADSGVSEDEEVRAYLTVNNVQFGGKTTIGVTAINEKSRFDKIHQKLKGMGMEILETNSSEEEDEYIGSYTAYTLVAHGGNSNSPWNVPHILVYGSLTPPIEESCYAVLGLNVDISDIRNHYVISGEELNEDDTVQIIDAIQESNEFSPQEKRDAISFLRTSDYI